MSIAKQSPILHCHSCYSVKDGSMTPERLVERAVELGAPAVALTDHGNFMGIIEFMKLCKQAGIKGIPGIEAYYTPTAKAKPRHLILMPKDYAGYQVITKAQTCAHIENTVGDFPCMNKDILERFFAPGKPGHGKVIATSACVGGVLAMELRGNETVSAQIAKLERKQEKYPHITPELLDAQKAVEDQEAKINDLLSKRETLTDKAKVTTTGLKRKLKTMTPGSEEYAVLDAEIIEKEAEKNAASAELEEVKKEIAAARRRKTELSKEAKIHRDSADKWEQIQEEIDSWKMQLVTEEELEERTRKEMVWFNDIFGAGNFFVEVQYHGIPDERATMRPLAVMADTLGIPLVAANDAHYATNSPADVRARTLLSALRFGQVLTPDDFRVPGYGQLYIKNDEELRNALAEVLPERYINQAMDNLQVIADACNVVMPHEEHYPKFRGGIPGETADARLRRLCEENIAKKYGARWCDEYQKRMDYELGIISKMGYSDYLCIVQDFLEYGRSRAKALPDGIGYTIGPGRGSAAGSIVCYLSGISSVDPMKYGLLFERFLNPERVSMPDIDSDYHPDVRGDVVDYARQIYGRLAVCNIATVGTDAAKGAIRDAARVTGMDPALASRISKMIPQPGRIADAGKELEELCASNHEAKQLVEDALLLEGAVVSFGTHAAGVIISDNDEVGDYVPLMLNDDGALVAQCNMGQAEKDCGLLKIDFLGLNNLKVISDAKRAVFKHCGLDLDIENLPFDKDVMRHIFDNGMTNAVFQFESGGMKKMLVQFKPETMEDLILLVAAYRPGPMQYLPRIINVKHGREVPHYIAKGLEEILAPTYGYPIYQEQIMQIFNKVCGFSLGEADVIRRIMSKKKLKDLIDPKTNYKGRFIDGLIRAGAKTEEAEQFWTEMLDFASYAFNKSHAACYAFISYYTAYLKYHYPAEYLCAVMNNTDYAKIPPLLQECRKFGLKLLPPNINVSEEGFSNVGDAITVGMGSIKDVGAAGRAFVAERTANGKFVSIKDIVSRMMTPPDGMATPDIAAYTSLIQAGAFDEFCSGRRESLLSGIKELIDLTKKQKDKIFAVRERQAALNAKIADGASEKERKRLELQLSNSEKALATLNTSIGSFVFPPKTENEEAKLEKERELLGFYFSGNPLRRYDAAFRKYNPKQIADIDANGKTTVAGKIQSVKELTRKRDGKKFCSFVLADATGEITVNCFCREYEKFKDRVIPGNIVAIRGLVTYEEDFNEWKLGLEEIEPVVLASDECISIRVHNIVDYCRAEDAILAYADPQGLPFQVHDLALNQILPGTLKLSPTICDALIKGVFIVKVKP